MKKKILMILCAICFVLPVAFLFAGCDKENNNHNKVHNHSYGNWTTISAAKCDALEAQERICSTCNKHDYRQVGSFAEHDFGEWETISAAKCDALEAQERICSTCNKHDYRQVGSFAEHDFGEWETSKVATCQSSEEQKRFCQNCDYRETRNVGNCLAHNFGEWEIESSSSCDDDEIEARYCLDCEKKETRYSEYQHGHNSLECKYENSEILVSCQDCVLEETFAFSDVFTTDGNGSVEYLDIYQGSFDYQYIVVKPVANPGYYFLKWEISENDNKRNSTAAIQEISTYSLLNQARYKAIFTNDESLIQSFDVIIEVENDLNVEVEYLPYFSKNDPYFSYFVHKNNDLVLSFASCHILTTDPDASYLGNIVSYVSEDDVEVLPFKGDCGFSSWLDEYNTLESVTLKFSDIRDKYILTLDNENCDGEEVRTIHNKNSIATINTKDLLSFEVFQLWKDENGNIISTNEEFDYSITKNLVVYLESKEADIMTEINDRQYFFIKNADNTLTLIDFSYDQIDTVEIPSEVEGMAVTGIGLLHATGFGGKLIIPDSVVDFEPYAFKYLGSDSGILPTISFASERQDLQATDFYGCNEKICLDLSETMIKSIVSNELHKLTKDYVNINVVFSNAMEEGVLGFYTNGTQNITIQKLTANQVYNRNILNVIVHELRHYYQAISIGSVDGLSIEDFKTSPTDNEVGAWKYLDYTQSAEDYNKYYYNAREVDAREYAHSIVGFNFV